MKVIQLKNNNALFCGSGIILDEYNTIHFYKNGLFHNEYFESIIELSAPAYYEWYYKSINYGFNSAFTIKSWKKKVKLLKREEKLKVFK